MIEAMGNPIPDGALEQHIAVVGKTGSGKSYAAQGIVELLLHRGERVCIIDPTDRYWGLRLAGDGKRSSRFSPIILGGRHADLPLAVTHGAAIAEIVATTATPAIPATRLLTVGERTRFFIDFAEALLRKNEGPLHLVIDEAHLFMPQAGARVGGAAPAMLHAGNNLVSLGRGIGLRIILLSQRPAKLHKDALTQVETLVAFRMIAPQDRAAIREWVREWADETTGAEMMASLPSLPTGTGWVWTPELDVLQQAAFPAVVTYDSGKPPVAGREGPALKPIDPDAVRGRLETIAKEAAENDPRRLKALIAELERAVAKAPATPPNSEELDRLRRENAELHRELDAMTSLISQWRGAIGDTISRLREIGAAPVRDIEVVPALAAPGAEAPPKIVDGPHEAIGFAMGDRSRARVTTYIPAPPKADGNGALPRGERACLAAIAQHQDGVTREQLTVLTGYKRSSRDTYLQRLRERGCVAQVDGRLLSTPEGNAALGPDFERLPVGDALREYWLGRLPEGERRVLEAVIGFYPVAATKTEIDEATGYRRSSRDTYIQRLRARALVITDRDGVRAAETLFGAA